MIEWLSEFVFEPLSHMTSEQFFAITFCFFIGLVFDSIFSFGNMCLQKAIEISCKYKDSKKLNSEK